MDKTGKPAQERSIDPAFVNTGFKNWKKALEEFSMQEKSEGQKLVDSSQEEVRQIRTHKERAFKIKLGTVTHDDNRN